MYPHHDNVEFKNDFSLPEEQETREIRFQQIGAKVAGIYLTAKRQAKSGISAFKDGVKRTILTEAYNETTIALQEQKKQLGKRYLIWAVVTSIASFVLGNICCLLVIS